MKSEAGIYILRLLKTINPIYTYLRIDKHSELLNNFTFDKNMNDFIKYHIYAENIKEISYVLNKHSLLRIQQISEKKDLIIMTGKTDIGTKYLIILIKPKKII